MRACRAVSAANLDLLLGFVKRHQHQRVLQPLESVVSRVLVRLAFGGHYLAAIDQPPFDDEARLIDALTDIWLAVIYNGPPTPRRGSVMLGGPETARSAPSPDGPCVRQRDERRHPLAAECVRNCALKLFGRHLAEVLGDSPPVAEWIGDLPVQLPPERLL
jgi:hypothetical protein